MQRRDRYRREYTLSNKDALALTGDADLCYFYEACIDAVNALQRNDPSTAHAGKQCANWLLNAGAKRANERSLAIHELGITPQQIAQIIDLRDRDMIGSSAADELFGLLCESDFRGADAMTLAQQRGLIQVKDEGQLEQWVDEAIAAQPQAASDFAAGKQAAVGRLVGHVMKASNGQADAKLIAAKLREKLQR